MRVGAVLKVLRVVRVDDHNIHVGELVEQGAAALLRKGGLDVLFTFNDDLDDQVGDVLDYVHHDGADIAHAELIVWNFL